MERDHKYSGTLPLLAYAPQDFGLSAQRSRAYRARAAMGRTGVQAPASAVKVVAVAVEPVPSSSLLMTLWSRVSQVFKKSKNTASPASLSRLPDGVVPKNAGPVRQRNSVNRPNLALSAGQPLAERIIGSVAADTDQSAQEMLGAAQNQPVSKTYAAMRIKNAAMTADDQTIPQAPDLAYALAEIREALREHEKLANARAVSGRPGTGFPEVAINQNDLAVSGKLAILDDRDNA